MDIIDGYQVFELVVTGQVDELRRADTSHLTAEDVWTEIAFHDGIMNGHLEAVQWLVKRFALTAEDARSCANYALRLGIENGQHKTVKWMIEYFDLTVEDARSKNNWALHKGIENGQHKTVKWLVTHFELTIEDARTDDNYALRQGMARGQVETVVWLCNWFRELWDDLEQLKEDGRIISENYEKVITYREYPLVKAAISREK